MARIIHGDDWDSNTSDHENSDANSVSQQNGEEVQEIDVCSVDDEQPCALPDSPTSDTNTQGEPSHASKSVDGEKYISRAPLHLAQRSRKCVSHERFEQLKKSFSINRGPWTESEIKKLKQNWKRIKKSYPNFADPKFAFGSGHYGDSSMSRYDVNKLRAQYRDFDIMLRMAYKLDDRLICDIYIRCRKMFYNTSFDIHQRKDIPRRLEKSIRRDLRRNESPTAISCKYNVSPGVVDMIKRRPKKKKRKSFKWNEESEQYMKQLIERMHDDCDQLLAREINWQRVARELKTFGYDVNKEQCYNKWIKIMPSTVVRRYSNS